MRIAVVVPFRNAERHVARCLESLRQQEPFGGESLLVRRVVEAHSPDAVRYLPAMLVRHLEIAGLHDYYPKSFVYGRSMRSLNGSTGRQLRTQERLAVWRRTVRREGYAALRATALLAALGGGAVCWGLGSLAGAARGPR